MENVEKKVVAAIPAQPEKVGPLDIVRALPNHQTQAVGPVIFLDHVPEKTLRPGELPAPDGSFAHPHRGIATFTYLLKGELIHFDSNGGHGLVKAGGVQWMNSGNGIVHDEIMPAELRAKGGEFSAFQFWVNLPAKNKAEAPDYMPVQASDLPTFDLGNGVVLKVLLGEFDGQESPIPTFSEQFIWHLKIPGNGEANVATAEGQEYAGYLANGMAEIGGSSISAQEFFELGLSGSTIRVSNRSSAHIDVMIFGGEPYREPMVSHGPFVMNTASEIRQAYADFQQGRYGQINYQRDREAV